MSLLLFESASPPKSLCLTAAGEESDLHSRQAQVLIFTLYTVKNLSKRKYIDYNQSDLAFPIMR